MTLVSRIVLEIKHLSANPRYRPDDIIWTLTADMTPEYNDIVEALITETKLNDHSTLKEILEGGPEVYEAASKAKDVNSGEGGACRYLNLYVGDQSALRLFLNTCEVSNHYWKVFMPKMTELGSKSSFSHREPMLREEKPLKSERPEPWLDNSTTTSKKLDD